MPARAIVARTAIFIGWVGLFAICACSDRRGSVALCERCNVVLVSMDTLRADHVGAYGYDRPTTPNLDGLAGRSVLFEDALSQSAWTRPAHFSMFTGLYPAEHGVVAMSGPSRLPDGLPTLAAVLSEQGYRTGGFTGGANVSAHFGFDDGFDVYETRGKRMLDNVESAKAWIDRDDDRPFFMFFHGLDPHRPYVSEPVDRLALGVPEQPEPGWKAVCKRPDRKRPRDVTALVGRYDAAIHRGDRAFGLLLDHLEQRGLMDETVVVVSSDHGEAFLEHGRCFHIYQLYDEVIRVPLVVHVPGLDAGRVAGIVPASVAIAPTVLGIVGIRDHPIPGPSLEPALRGGEVRFEAVVSETGSRAERGPTFGLVRALSTPADKLIHWVDHDRYEYYDLRSDPGEQRPISGSGREQILRGRLGDWVADHPPLAGPRASEPLPPGLARELRALGYVD